MKNNKEDICFIVIVAVVAVIALVTFSSGGNLAGYASKTIVKDDFSSQKNLVSGQTELELVFIHYSDMNDYQLYASYQLLTYVRENDIDLSEYTEYTVIRESSHGEMVESPIYSIPNSELVFNSQGVPLVSKGGLLYVPDDCTWIMRGTAGGRQMCHINNGFLICVYEGEPHPYDGSVFYG